MRTLIALAVGAVATLALIWALQRQLIYLPSRSVPVSPPGVEEVAFTTEDGLELSAWFVQTSSDPQGTILVLNGNAGNRSNRLALGAALSDERHAVLLVDYRGYGGNPGSPTESGLATDARAALAYLRARDDVDPNRIVYFGESLGAAVATRLAIEEPPAALVLRSPFTSLVDVGRVHYPFVPVSLLLRDRYLVESRIADLDSPVMVIFGTEDDIVPPDLSRAVYEAASEPKTLLVIGGAGHNDLDLLAGDEMIGGITDFLRTALQ